MLKLIVAVVLILFILAVISNIINQSSRQNNFGSYQKLNSLLTPAERSFYGVLQQAVEDSYLIFAKVRLADLFTVKANVDKSKKLAAFNKIAAKHVDFVLCDPATLQVVAAIELDDKSHKQVKRQIRDEFINGLFENNGLPLGRVAAKRAYSLRDVVELLSGISGLYIEDEPPNAGDFKLGDTDLSAIEDKSFQFSVKPKSRPFCPSCDSVMGRQKMIGGEGETWVCSNMPSCQTTVPIKKKIS